MSFFSSSPYGNLDKVDLQKKYAWNIVMPLPANFSFDLPLGLSIPEPGMISTKAISVDFGLPFSISTFIMDWGNRKNKSIEKVDVDDISIRFIEMEKSFIMLYFRLWWSNIVTKRGIYNPQSKYKKSILIILLSSDWYKSTVFRLDGCFPKVLPKYSLDYTSNDLLVIDVKFSCDNVVLLA